MGFALEPPLRRLMTPTGRLNLRVGCRMRPKPLGTFPRAFLSMRRHGAKNADYRGGVTCLYDTQLLGTCLHASESGGRSRPEAVRGMPDVPIAPPATGPNTVRLKICSRHLVVVIIEHTCCRHRQQRRVLRGGRAGDFGHIERRVQHVEATSYYCCAQRETPRHVQQRTVWCLKRGRQSIRSSSWVRRSPDP